MTITIGTLLAAHATGKSLTATIEETYARIEKHNDPALFITIRPKPEALAIAERMQASGPEGKPLYGVPFVVKDNIDVAGLPTTAACPAFAYLPGKSAFVVERLERAGAIVIGKTNLDQFATGLVGVRSPYGIPRNALRADLIPGGSSSGSATAVGAGLVPFSLGTDTAGSGRVPAAFNGIVGLKPSLRALSASGVVPACRTLDTISIFALDVEDAFAVSQAACAFDERDAYCRAFPPPALSALPSGIRLGVPRADQRLFFDDREASAAFSQDLRLAESLSARIVEFDFGPFAEVARALYEGPWVAERYSATKPLIESNPQALHPVIRAIIEGARKFDAVATFEAFYRLADHRRLTSRAWSEFDLMLVPTTPRLYTVAEVIADPIRLNSQLGTYTNFVNLLDLCAIAVPSSIRADGLPSSVTLIGPSGADGLIAGVAAAIQARSGASTKVAGRAAPLPRQANGDRIEIAVVGAHLSGLPLNRELIELGASYSCEVETTPDYRLFALTGSIPAKPGLLRVGKGAGSAIKAEVWALDPAGFGAFVAKIPAPLGIGTIQLSDGSPVKGFLVEAEAVKAAEDISRFGGWRAYLEVSLIARRRRWIFGARQRPLLEARKIKSKNVAQEIQKGRRPVLGAGLALLGRRLGSVARRAERMQIARHPTEADRLCHTKLTKLLLDSDRRADEISCFAHAHGLRSEGEHQRGLRLAAVNAVRALLSGKQLRGIAQPMPGRVDREHAVADPQLSHHRVDDRNVAAVRIHENELAAPGARDTVADLGPRSGDRLERKRERAGIFDVLVGFADRLDGQDQHRHVVGNTLDSACEVALVDEHIDPDWQVRPMLLDRSHRQNRDHFTHVRGGKVTPAHFGPELGWQHSDLPAFKLHARRRPRPRP